MFVKAIGTLLLLGFFYVQLGTSLECYSCNGSNNCNAPSKITCNSGNANATSDHLTIYYTQNLTSSISTNFECFHHNYTSVSNNVTYKGCIYRGIEPCDLTFREEHKQLRRISCLKCGGNLCNPAGTFSSSIVSIFSSILIVAVLYVSKM